MINLLYFYFCHISDIFSFFKSSMEIYMWDVEDLPQDPLSGLESNIYSLIKPCL